MNPHQETRTTEQIEADIGRTKSAIATEIKALGEKIGPDQLREGARHILQDAKQEAKEVIREAKDAATYSVRQAKEAAMDGVRTVKDEAMESVHHTIDRVGEGARRMTTATSSFVSTNAIPLTLLAVGAGWLYYTTRKQSPRSAYSVRPHDYARDLRASTGYGANFDKDDDESFMLHEQGEAHGIADRARDAGAGLYDRAQEGAQHLGQRAVEMGHRVSDRTVDLGRRAGRQLGRAQDVTTEFARDNPLALGGLAIALGVGIGLALPKSRVENDFLGPTRDRLAHEATSTAREAKRLVSETAHQVAHAAHGAVEDVKHAPHTS